MTDLSLELKVGATLHLEELIIVSGMERASAGEGRASAPQLPQRTTGQQ